MDSSKQRGKVRVIARIRGFGDQILATAPSISVRWLQSESSDSRRVVISFVGEQTTSSKQCNYEVDACYEQEAGNDVIFSQEIKPLISSVFEGHSATVFAYGARGSGKTYTIQGLENVPGLITLSLTEFLTQAKKVGNSISISFYEVLHDHVFDLLDSRRSDISILEDAQGKIKLKGLSEVTVDSVSQFQKLYFAILRRPLLKIANEPPQRSHIGMMINVLSSLDKHSDASLLGRMNLVDLAGYEDRRQSCSGPNLISVARINKSLYAVHNVLHALNGKETHVPYRESKLTRMLQESLGGMNRILMITCMDPSFSEDTVKALSLASRSCHVGGKAKLDNMTRVRSSIKTNVISSSSIKPTMVLSSKSKVEKVASSSVSRKQAGSLFPSIERKPHGFKVEGRRLFEELNQSDNTKKENVSKKDLEVTESSTQEEENMDVIDVSTRMQPSVGVSAKEEVGDILKSAFDAKQDNPISGTPVVNHHTLVSSDIIQADKENKSLVMNEGASPPLSVRLQELSNNLKSLLNSTPSNIEMVEANCDSINKNVSENDFLEPSTPVPQPSQSANDRCQYANMMSPWERFHIRSSGMKDSLVQELLNFLNTASKEELKGLKGIGEARATYILELREESSEPFKNLDDLKIIGLSSKQINGMMRTIAGDLFS